MTVAPDEPTLPSKPRSLLVEALVSVAAAVVVAGLGVPIALDPFRIGIPPPHQRLGPKLDSACWCETIVLGLTVVFRHPQDEATSFRCSSR